MKKDFNLDYLFDELNLPAHEADKLAPVQDLTPSSDAGAISFLQAINQKNLEEVSKFSEALKN